MRIKRRVEDDGEHHLIRIKARIAGCILCTICRSCRKKMMASIISTMGEQEGELPAPYSPHRPGGAMQESLPLFSPPVEMMLAIIFFRHNRQITHRISPAVLSLMRMR
jgi:hypothetical protein